jgi:hypothetical protein
MSLTQDTDKLFQSDAQHRKFVLLFLSSLFSQLPPAHPSPLPHRRAAIRSAKAEGAPIKLASKPLKVVVREGKDGAEADAWVAESGFIVRRVGLEVRTSSPLVTAQEGGDADEKIDETERENEAALQRPHWACYLPCVLHHPSRTGSHDQRLVGQVVQDLGRSGAFLSLSSFALFLPKR